MAEEVVAEEVTEKGLALQDQNPLDIITGLKKQLDALKHLSNDNFRTNGKVTGVPGGIKESDTVEKVAGIIAHLLMREHFRAKAYEALKIDSYPVYKEADWVVEDFIADAQKRIEYLTQHDKKVALEEAIKEMSEFVDKEDRKKVTLAKIAKLTGQ